ncbi:MAG TPA: sigma-70 family RNA polymerase sigma factor [Polyangiaceae bacterium]|nr:sigma-70 family RNA polymerase sigma factor [Polyangiaceae bacterium]
MSEQVELDQLVQRLAEGDRSAFTAAFRLLWPPVLRLCRGMLRNDVDAEDAAQQAMEKILTRSSDYDPARAALPWALAIASWECRTIRRKHARRREQPEPIREGTSETDQEELHIQRELVDAAVNAMGTLSETDRETLVATFWEEAASVQGPTLRKRRERAVTRLRAAFRRLYGLD